MERYGRNKNSMNNENTKYMGIETQSPRQPRAVY